MRKLVTALILVVPSLLHAQDYFSDLKAGGTPIFFAGDSAKTLFSTNITVPDGSIKANFFNQYVITSKRQQERIEQRKYPQHERNLGWGVSAKVKTEDGLGTVFNSGDFNAGFTGGAYLSLVSKNLRKNRHDEKVYGYGAWILGATYSAASYKLYNPDSSFSKQLTDTNFNGFSVSLSYVKAIFAGVNNTYVGGSFTVSRLSNYSSLDKVEIKNDSSYTNGAGQTRTATEFSDDGYTYAKGIYKEYFNYNFRGNVCFVPAVLDYQVGFILYPSVDLSKEFSPRYNIGASVAFLKRKSPTTPIAALYVELNDITNAKDVDKPFMKRAFKIGVSANLNIVTGSVK